jgi:hypothetical protein
MPTTPGHDFYDRQIAFLEANDLDGLIGQYADDAVLVSFDRVVRGKEALREYMRGYLGGLGTLQLVSTDRFTETEDSIFFEATVRSLLGEAKVYDVFILRDGVATHQFTGVISMVPAVGG